MTSIEPRSNNTQRIAIITGATSGLGYETALELAQQNWNVILTGRNDIKGTAALEAIQKIHPQATIEYQNLDLASLASVASFSQSIKQRDLAIDVLVNNAGVMAPPTQTLTEDGFELQLGTNHFGHFALTAQLLSQLQKAPHPRVVNVSSISHRQGKINFKDLQSHQSYDPMKAYAQSKLANILFTLELDRLSQERGWNIQSIAAHPGVSETPLFYSGPGTTRFLARLLQFAIPYISQSAKDGAQPILQAILDPNAIGGQYYGPQGFQEIKGKSGLAKISRHAKNPETAKQLWDVSEQLTGIIWP